MRDRLVLIAAEITGGVIHHVFHQQILLALDPVSAEEPAEETHEGGVALSQTNRAAASSVES
jgi:hypothetical protein